MSVLGKFFQSPTEKKRYTVDYSDWLDEAETISSLTTSVVSLNPAAGTTPVVVTSNVNAPAYTTTLYLSGGDADGRYKIVMHIVTNGNQYKDDEFLLDVRAL